VSRLELGGTRSVIHSLLVVNIHSIYIRRNEPALLAALRANYMHPQTSCTQLTSGRM
jgi:hypothetical protein